MYKGNTKMDTGAFYAPYIPLTGMDTLYVLVEIFEGINVINSLPILRLEDIQAEGNTLYRVRTKSGKNKFMHHVYYGGFKTRYGVGDSESYVADAIPHYEFLEHIEDAKPFLNCTEEEYLMFVLKYGQDFNQG